MVASKGGVSYEACLTMPLSERRALLFALAKVHNAEVDWDTGEIRPPKDVQEAVARTVSDRMG